jgi:hypothetical protein
MLNHITNADLYVRELDLVVNVDGPTHFYLDEPSIRIPNLLDDFVPKYVDVLRLNYTRLDEVLRFSQALVRIKEDALNNLKFWLKDQIDEFV